jgi:hypothetical protein
MPVGNLHFVFSFSPEESSAFGPSKVMKNASYLATTLVGSALSLPFVIPTGAYRSSYFALLATTTS